MTVKRNPNRLTTSTVNHLYAWVRREYSRDGIPHAEERFNAIVEWIEGMDQDDAERLLKRGWRQVDDEFQRTFLGNPHMRPLGVPRDDDRATDYLELGTPASHRSIARAQRELDAARKRFRKPYHIAVWEERDRLHINLQDADDETIIEWWDDEAREAIEDGFLIANKGRARLLESAVEYATHMGLL